MSNATPTRRDDLAVLLGDLSRLEEIFAGWDEGPRNAVKAYREAIDQLHREALQRLIRTLRSTPAAAGALKSAAADEIVYAVLRHHELVKPSLNERIESALESVRPMLASHGGDVQLVNVTPPTAEVRLVGACNGCASSSLTFQAGIKKAIQDVCPEITKVIQVGGAAERTALFVSPFAPADAGTWLPACTLAEIPEGGILAASIGGEDVVLSRRGVAVSCFQNACAHLGLAIHEGKVIENTIVCPHHGFRYDLASGECLTAPEVQLQAHAVRVVGNRVEVRLAR